MRQTLPQRTGAVYVVAKMTEITGLVGSNFFSVLTHNGKEDWIL